MGNKGRSIFEVELLVELKKKSTNEGTVKFTVERFLNLQIRNRKSSSDVVSHFKMQN